MWFENKPNTVLFILYLFGHYPYYYKSIQTKSKLLDYAVLSLPSWIWLIFGFLSFNELINQYTNENNESTFSSSSTYVSIGFLLCLNFITRYESIRSLQLSLEIPTISIDLVKYIEQAFRLNILRECYFRQVYRKGFIIVVFMSIGLCMNLITPSRIWSYSFNYYISIELVYKDFSTLYLILMVDFNRYLLDRVMKNLDNPISSTEVYTITYDYRKITKMLRQLKIIHFKISEYTGLMNDHIGWAALSSSLDAFWRTMSGIYWGLTSDTDSYFYLLCKYICFLNNYLLLYAAIHYKEINTRNIGFNFRRKRFNIILLTIELFPICV